MSALSDVLVGGGGAPRFTTDDVQVSLTGSTGSPATLDDRINKDGSLIYHSDDWRNRDRITRGAALGSFVRIKVRSDSQIVRIEEAAAMANGIRPLTLALMPGADGYLWSNGTEWIWYGSGAVTGPIPKGRINQGFSKLTSSTITTSYYGTVILSPTKVLTMWRNSSDTTQLCAGISTFDADGNMTAWDEAGVIVNDANTLDGPFFLPLSEDTVFMWWEDAVSSQAEACVLSISGVTITKGTTVAIANATVASFLHVIPFRNDPTRVLLNYVSSGPTAFSGTIAIATLSGSGASRTFSLGAWLDTYTSGAWNGFINSSGPSMGFRRPHNCFAMIQDPNDGTGNTWYGVTGHTGGTNLHPQLTKFTVSGTSISVSEQWSMSDITANRDGGQQMVHNEDPDDPYIYGFWARSASNTEEYYMLDPTDGGDGPSIRGPWSTASAQIDYLFPGNTPDFFYGGLIGEVYGNDTESFGNSQTRLSRQQVNALEGGLYHVAFDHDSTGQYVNNQGKGEYFHLTKELDFYKRPADATQAFTQDAATSFYYSAILARTRHGFEGGGVWMVLPSSSGANQTVHGLLFETATATRYAQKAQFFPAGEA